MEALINTFFSHAAQNIDLAITIKGKTHQGKTSLTVLVSEGEINKKSNDIEITAEIVSRPGWTDPESLVPTKRKPPMPTLDEHVPLEPDE